MNSNPSDGVYVNGIFIDGARWDRNRGVLAEQSPKVLIEAMPAMHLVVNNIIAKLNTTHLQFIEYFTANKDIGASE